MRDRVFILILLVSVCSLSLAQGGLELATTTGSWTSTSTAYSTCTSFNGDTYIMARDGIYKLPVGSNPATTKPTRVTNFRAQDYPSGGSDAPTDITAGSCSFSPSRMFWCGTFADTSLKDECWSIPIDQKYIYYDTHRIIKSSGNSIKFKYVVWHNDGSSNGALWVTTTERLAKYKYSSGSWSLVSSYLGSSLGSGIQFGPLYLASSWMFAGTTSGAIVRCPLNVDGGNFVSSSVVSVGALPGQPIRAIAGIATVSGTQYLVLGGSSAIGMFSLSSYSTPSNLVAFTPDLAPVNAIALDPSIPVAYIGTNGNGIFRVNLGRTNGAGQSTLVISDSSYVYTSAINIIWTMGGTSNKVVGVAANSVAIVTNMANCGSYACSTCGTVDQEYCGYCADSGTCSLVPSRGGGCVASLFSQPSVCPEITALSVTRGSTSGNTLTTISATNLYSGPTSSSYQCFFGATEGAVTMVTSNTIICSSPSAGAGDVSVTVKYGASTIAGAKTYTYYNCESLSCATCSDSQYSECTWCYGEATCKTASLCTGPKGSTCPVFTGLPAATSSVKAGGDSVVLASNFIFSDVAYSCRFGGNSVTAAVTSPAQGRVTCTTPLSAIVGNVAVDLMVGPKVYTTNAHTFTLEYYDCTAISACFTCLNNHPACKVCPSDAQRCQYSTSTCSNPVLDPASCPTVSTFSPTTLHVSDVNAELTFEVSEVPAGTNECEFRLDSGPPTATTATVSGLTIKCPAPGTLSVGAYHVTLRASGTLVTAPVTLSVYDCSYPTCQTCPSAARPKCAWCFSSMSCTASSGGCADVTTDTTDCPVITSIAPTADTLAGGANVTITASRIVTAASPKISCDFANVGTADATVDGSNFTCQAPPATDVINTNVSLLVNSVQFTDSRPFSYYTCATAPSCDQCFQLQGCTWCGAACSPIASCASASNNCPKMESVTPTFAESDIGEYIRVVMAEDIPVAFGYEYQCVFNGQYVSPDTLVSGSDIDCFTPPNMPTGAGTVRVDVKGVGQWSSNTLPFEFYRCPTGTFVCNSACSATKHCGWCYETGSCTGEKFCGTAGQALWTNNTECPTVVSIGPDHVQILNNSTVTTEMVIQVSPELQLQPSSDARKRKRSITVDDFSCAFNSVHQNASSLNPTTNIVTCDIPDLGSPGFYDFYLLFKGNRINAERKQFQAVDCEPFNNLCGVCVFSPKCGWCPGASKCNTQHRCSLESINVWNNTCPDPRTLIPQLIDLAGGAEIVLTANYLVYSPDYYVRINDNIIKAQYVSATQLSFIAPASALADPNTVEVYVYLNNTLYATDPLSLNYISDSGVGAAVLAPTISLAALVIIGLIVALIIMKTRKIGFFNEFKLKEPDYVLVAFGPALLEEQYKPPKDNWDILIQKINKEPNFVNMLVLGTASTEEDQLARTLVYVFEKYDQSVPSMVRLIQREINLTTFENTLFRQNSITSKMFKFYSKVVGINYLFNNLARYILELDRLAARKVDTSSGGNKSLLSMEMEVDPDKFGTSESTFQDSEANLYQLILACQKIFATIRDSINEIPAQWKDIFRALKDAVYFKFASEDAVFKGVGGFLFLRFIGPAITAPHAYGLLEFPPNQRAQRQLVLIGKVIQSLANMQMPGQKEVFMQSLNDFFARNIPKMKDFYIALLAFDTFGVPRTQPVEVPNVVVNNVLGWCYSHILTNQTKMRGLLVESFAPNEAAELNKGLDELIERYGDKAPKKIAKEDKKSGKKATV